MTDRIIGEHFNPGGKPKRRFKTRRAAETWLRESGLEHRFTIYHCSFCNGWHLASVKLTV